MKRMGWLLGLALVPLVALAGPGGPPRADQIVETLGLNESRAQEVQGVIAEHEANLRAAREEMKGAIDELRTAVDAGDNKPVKQAIAAVREAEEAMRAEGDALRDDLFALLTPEEQGTLMLKKHSMRMEMRHQRRPPTGL